MGLELTAVPANYGVTTLMMAVRVCSSLVPKVVDNIHKSGQNLKDFINKLDYAGHAAGANN